MPDVADKNNPLTFFIEVKKSQTFSEEISYSFTAEVCELREDQRAPYGLASYDDRRDLANLKVSASLTAWSKYGPDELHG